MAKNYQTKAGDFVDQICYGYYGAAGINQSIAAVLEANPGIADYGPDLPAGVPVVLPTWSYEPESAEELELWD